MPCLPNVDIYLLNHNILNIAMIDQMLINRNTDSLLSSIEHRTAVLPSYLFSISKIFDMIMIEKLKTYLDTCPPHLWTIVENQEMRARKKITWHVDTVVEELHNVFDNVTKTINTIFDTSNKFFWGISIWKDSPGYYIDWHTDNSDIDIAIQVYLYTGVGLGTVFKINQDEVIVPSVHNSAYVIRHADHHKLLHRSESIVPIGCERYSLYAVWSRFPKHLTNTQ